MLQAEQRLVQAQWQQSGAAAAKQRGSSEAARCRAGSMSQSDAERRGAEQRGSVEERSSSKAVGGSRTAAAEPRGRSGAARWRQQVRK